jgi:hypothetical protein
MLRTSPSKTGWQDLDLGAGVWHIRQALAGVKRQASSRPKTILIFHLPKIEPSERGLPLSPDGSRRDGMVCGDRLQSSSMIRVYSTGVKKV